jgi:serine/threonine protein kinase
VIKKLRPSFPLADATIFRASAAADLAVEARILSSLPRHTNIITLHAISENFFSDPDSGFLVLDGLSETLSDRIKWWRSEMKGGLAVLSLLQSKAQTRFEKAREVSRATSIGLPVASAMSFLHKRRIVYRDIKPANVGFDHQGNVRIFDFGLARVYNPKRGLMTPCSGTIRYMCPVAMTGGNYDLSADVYSFAILLWEVCNRTQQQPFASIKSVEAAKRSIAGMRYRPPLRQIYNANLKKIMRYGWDQDPQMRPSFPSIVSTLERMKPKES